MQPSKFRLNIQATVVLHTYTLQTQTGARQTLIVCVECDSASARPSFVDPTSLSVLVSVTRTCNTSKRGLSKVAIIGISVACGVVALAVVTGVTLLMMRRKRMCDPLFFSVEADATGIR